MSPKRWVPRTSGERVRFEGNGHHEPPSEFYVLTPFLSGDSFQAFNHLFGDAEIKGTNDPNRLAIEIGPRRFNVGLDFTVRDDQETGRQALDGVMYLTVGVATGDVWLRESIAFSNATLSVDGESGVLRIESEESQKTITISPSGVKVEADNQTIEAWHVAPSEAEYYID